eukprot:11525439-Ditylum_brightwellii.AAC.1
MVQMITLELFKKCSNNNQDDLMQVDLAQKISKVMIMLGDTRHHREEMICHVDQLGMIKNNKKMLVYSYLTTLEGGLVG